MLVVKAKNPKTIKEEWVLNIKEQCNAQKAAFYLNKGWN
jgi:protein gp37